jgi:hypothetical protein
LSQGLSECNGLDNKDLTLGEMMIIHIIASQSERAGKSGDVCELRPWGEGVYLVLGRAHKVLGCVCNSQGVCSSCGGAIWVLGGKCNIPGNICKACSWL